MIKEILKKIIDNIIYLESFFVTVKKDSKKKKLLILRKDMLGDILMFYPTLKTYRDKYTNYNITLILNDSFQSLSPLLSDFENIIWFNHNKYRNNFFYRRSFLLNLKRAGYNTAIYPAFSREPAGNFMMKISKAENIIGCDGDTVLLSKEEKIKTNKLYTKLITVPNEITHDLHRNKYIVEQITGQVCSVNFPTVDIKKLTNEKAEHIVKQNNLSNNNFAIMFPGAGGAYRMWPIENFSKVADYLIKKNTTPIICGSFKENYLALKLISLSENPKKIINLCGQTDLPTMAHLLAKSQVYVGNDTGIAHLSLAVNTETAVLLGGGHFGRFFPYLNNPKCHIIYDKNMTCKNDNWKCVKDFKANIPAPCIKNITVSEAISEINNII